MESAIKTYKPILYIQSFDWDITYTSISLDDMKNILENNEKFLKIWDKILNKSDIRRVFKQEADEIELFIIQQPKHIQDKLREKMESKTGGRKLPNLQRYTQNILNPKKQ